MEKIITIKAFTDNLIYLYQYSRNKAIVIDPGDSTPVLEALEKYNLSLTAILATHHHMDHVGGAAELKKKTGCQVIAGDKKRVAGINNAVEDDQILKFDNTDVKVIATPGHTYTSVCYYIPKNEKTESGIVFTGDTLFIGGCGRLFEGNAETMWNSLQRLAALPEETKVYCGHDYTLENYMFALQAEPNNQLISERIEEIKRGKLSVSSTIAWEKATNIFLRANSAEVFAELRRCKDLF